MKIFQHSESLEDLEKIDSTPFGRNSRSLVVDYLNLLNASGTNFQTTLEKQKT